MAFINLLSAGVIISVAYRAGHAMTSFRNDVMANEEATRAWNASLALLRRELIQYGIGFGVFYVAASKLKELRDNAQGLETAMKGVQLVTRSNAEAMRSYRSEFFEAQILSKYTSQDAFEQMLTLSRMVPSADPKAMAKTIRPVLEGATLLEQLPPHFKKEQTTETYANLINMMLPASQKTTAKMTDVVNLATSALASNAFKNPDTLIRALSFIPHGAIQARPDQQMGFAALIANKGLSPGKSAMTAGRTIEDVYKVLIGDFSNVTGRKGGNPAKLRSILGEDAGNYMQNGWLDLVGVLRDMRTKALQISKEDPGKWEQIASGFGKIPARFLRTLGDPNQNAAMELEQIIKRMNISAQDWLRAQNTTGKGSQDFLNSAVSELGQTISLEMQPAVTMFNLRLGEMTAGLNRFILSLPAGVVRGAMDVGGLAVSGGEIGMAAMLGYVAKRFLFSQMVPGLIATTAFTVTPAILLPVVAAVLAAISTSGLWGPAVLDIGAAMAKALGFDPRSDAERAGDEAAARVAGSATGGKQLQKFAEMLGSGPAAGLGSVHTPKNRAGSELQEILFGQGGRGRGRGAGGLLGGDYYAWEGMQTGELDAMKRVADKYGLNPVADAAERAADALNAIADIILKGGGGVDGSRGKGLKHSNTPIFDILESPSSACPTSMPTRRANQDNHNGVQPMVQNLQIGKAGAVRLSGLTSSRYVHDENSRMSRILPVKRNQNVTNLNLGLSPVHKK